MPQLYEKYRPKTWSELVGQGKAVTMVRRILERPGFDRGAFWIESGGVHNSGVGKTSLALLIAHHLAAPFFVTQFSGAQVDKATVREIERASHLYAAAGDKPFRVAIIDEAHAITQGAVDMLLPMLEALPEHFVVIFTTTRKVDAGLFGDDCGPFASRCHRIKLTNQGLATAMAPRLKEIATLEDLDGQPLDNYITLIRDKCQNNMRAALQRIESGEML